MDDNFRSFLEKFAELERRIRKLGAEDRALRDEVKSLSERLEVMEAETAELKDKLARERSARKGAGERVSGLIDKLEGLRDSGMGGGG